MRTIIAGGRDYHLTGEDLYRLDALPITVAIVGGCRGVDQEAEEWATRRGLLVEVYQADWKKYGKSAGPIRNRLMARKAEACVLFPGGRGTEDMYQAAIAVGLVVHDYRAKTTVE